MYIYNQFVNPPKDWEIPVDDIFIGPRIGAGSFGTVYKVRRDTWGGGYYATLKACCGSVFGFYGSGFSLNLNTGPDPAFFFTLSEI